MVSGVILQLERALLHLSVADRDQSVAIEVFDDVSVQAAGRPVLVEQDKKTTRGRAVLGDRSRDLWRTLQIWVGAFRASGAFCDRHLLVTNALPRGAVADALRLPPTAEGRAARVVTALRAAGALRHVGRSGSSTPSKIQQLIDDVLAAGDELLGDLAGRIELIDGYDSEVGKVQVANGFGVHPDVDADAVIDATMGWLVHQLRSSWDRGEPAVITKAQVLRQVRGVEERQRRRRLLPRPASEVVVDGAEVASARGRPFVDHLGRIDVDDEEVYQSIEHFLQFSIERYRLAKQGEIPLQEWADRGARLTQRWRNVVREVRLKHVHRGRAERGKLILAETTYHHRESLSGQSCDELYMTSGHYHRLADEDVVWWDPDYEA